MLRVSLYINSKGNEDKWGFVFDELYTGIEKWLILKKKNSIAFCKGFHVKLIMVDWQLIKYFYLSIFLFGKQKNTSKQKQLQLIIKQNDYHLFYIKC